MKRLLVATDLSPRSDRALDRSLALSAELKAQLTILHIVDEELPSKIADRLMGEAEATIDNLLNRLPKLERENVTRKVVFGGGFRSILEEADESIVDVIIMGTHRETTLHGFFLGTTVERVIRNGNHPVIVVKDRMASPYRRILVGIDFSVYSRKAIEFALEFVPNGEFFLVHAFDLPFKGFLGRSTLEEVRKKHQQQMDEMLEKEMQAFLASLPSPPSNIQQVMREGLASEVISKEVKKLRPDLLVIGTHGRTGVAHALLGSVAEDLLRDPPCDVLAVKAW